MSLYILTAGLEKNKRKYGFLMLAEFGYGHWLCSILMQPIHQGRKTVRDLKICVFALGLVYFELAEFRFAISLLSELFVCWVLAWSRKIMAIHWSKVCEHFLHFVNCKAAHGLTSIPFPSREMSYMPCFTASISGPQGLYGHFWLWMKCTGTLSYAQTPGAASDPSYCMQRAVWHTHLTCDTFC